VFIPKDFVWLAQHLSNLVVGERTVRTGLGAHAADEPINGFNTLTFLCCTVQELPGCQKCTQTFQLRDMCRIFGGCNPHNAVNGITYSAAGRISRYTTGVGWAILVAQPTPRYAMYRRSYGGATPATTFAYPLAGFVPSSSNSSLASLCYRFWLCVLV
jgi:hypothetical protein